MQEEIRQHSDASAKAQAAYSDALASAGQAVEREAHHIARIRRLEAELAATRLQRSEAARFAAETELAHERAARKVAEQVFAGEVADDESAAVAAQAAIASLPIITSDGRSGCETVLR